MTVSNQAMMDTSLYNFYNSSAYQQNAVAAAASAEKAFGVTDISSAFDSLDSTIYSSTALTNLDSYVKDQYQLSQLSEYGTLKSISENSANPLYAFGSAGSSAATDTLESSLNLLGGGFDPYSILNVGATVGTDLLSANLSTGSGSSGITAYQNLLGQTPSGSLINITA